MPYLYGNLPNIEFKAYWWVGGYIMERFRASYKIVSLVPMEYI